MLHLFLSSTAGNGVHPYSDVRSFWSLGSRRIDAPVSSVTDSVESVIEGKSSKTDENKRYSRGALGLPWKDKEAKMTDSGTCSHNQYDLCCISSSRPTTGNSVRPHSDVHDCWSLGSIGINAPVSSMTDSGTCSNKQNDSNMSDTVNTCSDNHNDFCCISLSPLTAGNGVSPHSDVHDLWSLGSIGINAPVSSLTDSGTCSNKQNDSNMSVVTPSVFSMTDASTCSNNQNNLCCISPSPPTAGNGVHPYSDVHNFWSLGSGGIDAPVSSMTDSVEAVMEGKSSKTDKNKRYYGALSGKDKEEKANH